jgi:Family of unknown function (DUF5709)
MADDGDNPVEDNDSIDASLENDGLLDPTDTLDGPLDDDPLDQGIDAGDRYSAGERFGTTLTEERQGESLDQLLAEEEPDIDYTDAGGYADADTGENRPAGRLVAEDEGAHATEESNLVAQDVGFDGGADSAEEDAIHIVDGD